MSHTLLHTEACTHKNFYTQKLLHTNTFTHKSFYTQKLLHTEAFYTQTLLHTDTFTHRHFYPQKILHADTFTHRRFYTQKKFYTQTLYTQTFLHTEAFTHRSFYTQTLLHTEAFTHRRFYTQKHLDKWHMFIPYHPPIRSLRSFLNRLDEMSLGLLWTRWINTSSTARASQDMPVPSKIGWDRAGELMSGPLSQNGTRPESSTKSGPHVSCDIHVFTRQVAHVYPLPPTDQELALIFE